MAPSDNLGCVCGLIDFLCSLGLKRLQAVALQAVKTPVPLPPLIGGGNVLNRELYLLRVGMLYRLPMGFPPCGIQ